MKYRPQRELLEEAMLEVIEVTCLEDVRKFHNWEEFGMSLGTLTCRYYGYDKRIDWDTWLVCQNGNGLGFANGELK